LAPASFDIAHLLLPLSNTCSNLSTPGVRAQPVPWAHGSPHLPPLLRVLRTTHTDPPPGRADGPGTVRAPGGAGADVDRRRPRRARPGPPVRGDAARQRRAELVRRPRRPRVARVRVHAADGRGGGRARPGPAARAPPGRSGVQHAAV